MTSSSSALSLKILHFNDVYHLDEQKQEPRGGASRLYAEITRRKKASSPTPLVLFSGDCFNPSIESSVTKGSHMLPVLNRLGIDVACYGNHDFDFGVGQLEHLASQCNFSWLLTNVLVPGEDEVPLAKGQMRRILEWEGLRIGVIGLVEQEWLETISNLPDLTYEDFLEVALRESAYLRSEAGGSVDLVIALTHMRVQNDERLAREAGDAIDLILGGHDHFVYYGSGTNVLPLKPGVDTSEIIINEDKSKPYRIIKSGCDFKNLSSISLEMVRDPTTGKYHRGAIQVESIVLDSSIPQDEGMNALIEELTGDIQGSLSHVIGWTLTPLDARSQVVRTQESAIGNFAADIMRHYWPGVDIALLCGGTIRGDAVHPPGPLMMRDILDIFPFEDPCVVVRVKGSVLLAALESSVSLVPRQEGRFPVLSGARLIYAPEASPGRRVHNVWFSGDATLPPPTPDEQEEGGGIRPRYNEQALEMDRVYTVCTRAYMAKGHDGFEVFTRGGLEYVVDEEQGILLSTMLRRFFIGLKYSNAIRFRDASPSPDATHEAVCAAARKFKGLLVGKRGRKTIETALARSGDSPPVGKPWDEAVREDTPSSRWEDVQASWSSVDPKVEGRIISVAP